MMHCGDFEKSRTTMDFSSAGLDSREVTRLSCDGIPIVNALELVDWEWGPDSAMQIMVCDHCGTTHCAGGNWVQLRRSRNQVIMMPPFEWMREDEWSCDEYAPPQFMRKNGALICEYSTIKRTIPVFPELSAIPELTFPECLLLLQLEAPQAILGQFPDRVTLHPEKLVAAEIGEVSDYRTLLERLLAEPNECGIALTPVQRAAPTLYVDETGLSEWRPLILAENSWHLMLAPNFMISEPD